MLKTSLLITEKNKSKLRFALKEGEENKAVFFHMLAYMQRRRGLKREIGVN
jgi:hypothetical protein